MISRLLSMKNDIENKNDIKLLVNTFYEDVKVDELIGPFFNKIDWDKHIPIMCKFWENVLFYTGNYTGNPMLRHKLIHENMPMNEEQFIRWIDLFKSAVDELFIGEKAELMKQRANSIASIMQLKILV